MLIRLGYELIFDLNEPVAMTLMLDIHPSRQADVRAYRASIEPDVPVQTFTDSFGNICKRVLAPAGKIRFFADGIVEDSGLPDANIEGAIQHNVEDLPSECLQFLLNSRYCEVDKMVPIAWELFGHTNPGWERVRAICDWVHQKVTFGYAYARPTKSAFDVYAERMGVCRDFSHTALTLCRCMNIPARYTTGYLGDIGVPQSASPMDFSGWFEVYLGGKWHTCDARHNKPRIGRIVMAYGRDATDVALTTSYGSAPLVGFKVVTEVVEEDALADFA
ncbi:Transglutaminase-like enzyme, putative cysteine protease [Abditibacterium utsteinense]|uniref:Transglutaminase-like enzyme, putative cysteine protease n=1 Tax=Abditibacterium utsteinense TaxID=1960156 RepID=A0A2S8SXL8_9BACT|nr:transglutaminase family protein [Abditibacterium utsteinense]PQV65534.1 Transglutaminase-like enzyme, putative cysteine protease [Abditibacterium utsteinense]